VDNVTINSVATTVHQHNQHSKVYRRAPGEVVTGTVEYAFGRSVFGQILVARTQRGICAILFGEDEYELVEDLSKHFPKATLIRDGAAMSGIIKQVVEFIEVPNGVFTAALDIGGTSFQQQVWQFLREIPPGQTFSYSDVASKLGRPGSVRAVGGACAANAIAIAIPCHRVVRNDGSISGYRWGIELKKQLLRMEASA
jgi:AraC family transcriptional regulator of adaptative response/methylated-DNA-[protein]-cysteine methyltransferase